MNVGGYTATGPRDANEDNFYFLDFSDVDSFVNGICAFAMVSDGMGGYQGGDVASGLAVACAKSYLSQLIEMAGDNQIALDAPAALAEIVQNAHESILAESNRRGNLSMGATFVGAFVSRSHAWIGHVGDSRCYLVRDGRCQQLTEDHSQVGRMLSRGVITEEEAQNHPDRNRIERALGFNDARPDVTEVDLVPGDALLLCSDGVYTVLDAATLGSCVDGARDAAAAAQRAVKLAIRRGTDDNSTAVVVIDGEGTSRKPARTSTLSEGVSRGDTQVSAPLHRTQVHTRSQAYRRYGASDTAPWKRLLPFVLAVLLVGAAVYMGLRGCSDNARTGQVTPEETVAPEATGDGAPTDAATTTPAPAEQPSSQETQPTVSETPASTVAVPAGYERYTIAQDSAVALKYIDQDGTAQLFSYEPLALAADPLLLPGMTVVAQTTSGSYGRIEKTYQMLSDSYLDDLKRDVSRYLEGSMSFDSALSQLIEPTAYLTFVQALSQVGTETIDGTVAHLAVETLIVTGQ